MDRVKQKQAVGISKQRTWQWIYPPTRHSSTTGQEHMQPSRCGRAVAAISLRNAGNCPPATSKELHNPHPWPKMNTDVLLTITEKIIQKLVWVQANKPPPKAL